MKFKSKHEWYLSNERDFFSGQVNTVSRYLICSSPRSGSTLLGQMLYDSRVAGDPLEYLNSAYMTAAQQRFGHSRSMSDYLAVLEKYRTSENGVFGMKIHWSHFEKIFKDESSKINFLDRWGKIIFIRRKNKILQAVSLFRASRSNIWSSLDQDFQSPDPSSSGDKFEPALLSKFLQYVIWQDQCWETRLNQLARPIQVIYYEDMIENWDVVSKEVLQFVSESSEVVPAMGLEKQRSEHDDLALEFTRYLMGVDNGPLRSNSASAGR